MGNNAVWHKDLLLKYPKKLSNFPFSPIKLPFFYGWAVLFLGAFGILMSIPGQTMGVSVFTDHLIEALKLSRRQLSTAYLAGTLTSAMFLPFAGRFSDRFGIRITAVLSGIMMSGVLFYMSRVDRVAVSVARQIHFVTPHQIAFVSVAAGFFLLRFSGQGVMTMVSRNMVMKWFDRHRGAAAALMGLITTFGFSVAPTLLAWLKGLSSWRGAWVQLGLLSLLVFTPIALLLYRDNPRECGLNPDGASGEEKSRFTDAILWVTGKSGKAKADADAGKELDERLSATTAQALSTPKFWVYNLTLAFWALFNTAFTFHLISIFAQSGKGEAAAVVIHIPIAVLSTSIRSLGSAFYREIKLQRMLYVMLLALGITALTLGNLGNPVMLVFTIIGLGVAQGLFGVLNALTWIEFFGPKHLGSITGITMSSLVAGSAIGPWLFSVSAGEALNYANAGLVCLLPIGLLLCAAIAEKPLTRLFSLIRNPDDKQNV